MQHIAVLTNLLTPASAPLYNELTRHVPRVTVFLTGDEDNREWQWSGSWMFHVQRPWGIVIKGYVKGQGKRRLDRRYLHIPLGLLHALRRQAPDAVLSSEMGLRTLMAKLYCASRGVPLLVQWEGTLHNQRNIGRIKRFIRRHGFVRMIKHWLAIGTASKQYLMSIGVPESAIHTISYALEKSRFVGPVTPSLDLTPKPVLLFVGRFARIKGLQELFQAVARLQREGLSFTTLLVGDGEEGETLKALGVQLAIQHLVMIPFTQPDELPAMYRSADLFVLPSLSDGWGLVVGEALASDLPVLCSVFAGAAADLVPESWQFDPTDAEDFAGALRRAIMAGREGRKAFPPTSQLAGPADIARAILNVLSAASQSK